MMVSNRNLLFQGVIFRCHVSFREGMWQRTTESFRWISVASKFHIFFWESPDHMLNPWGSLSGHIHTCQLLWFLQNIQDDSSRDLFIPYLEVTKTAFWFRVTNFQHPKKGHQPAALPGRFVKKAADDQPFSARHTRGSITNSYPGRRRSRNTRYNLGARPGENRAGKKPSRGKVTLWPKTGGSPESQQFGKQGESLETCNSTYFGVIYRYILHVYIIYVYIYIFITPREHTFNFRWFIGGSMSTPLVITIFDGGPAGRKSRILPWNWWSSKPFPKKKNQCRSLWEEKNLGSRTERLPGFFKYFQDHPNHWTWAYLLHLGERFQWFEGPDSEDMEDPKKFPVPFLTWEHRGCVNMYIWRIWMNWKSQTPKSAIVGWQNATCGRFWRFNPQESNVEPENHVFEEENHSPNLTFLGSRCEFSGG